MRAFRLDGCRQSGFTLIEAIMVIVITGILATIVAVFITKPVQGYVDSVRRAELTDAADVALRRITRDVRLALPNTLRIATAGGVNYIEFIMTGAGGLYRDEHDGSTGDFLSFTNTSDLTFDVLGTMPSNPAIAVGDYIVVNNVSNILPGHDAYATVDICSSCNRAKIAAIAGNNVTILGVSGANNPFAGQYPSPSNRFQVVPGSVRSVTYACPTMVPGNLTRYWNYGFNATIAGTIAALPSVAPASQALLVGGNGAPQVTCEVAPYFSGLLSITLTLTDSTGSESVTLFQQIHVDNTP